MFGFKGGESCEVYTHTTTHTAQTVTGLSQTVMASMCEWGNYTVSFTTIMLFGSFESHYKSFPVSSAVGRGPSHTHSDTIQPKDSDEQLYLRPGVIVISRREENNSSSNGRLVFFLFPPELLKRYECHLGLIHRAPICRWEVCPVVNVML